MGFDAKISLADLVAKKASLALQAGVDGVVASVLEAKKLRAEFGNNFLIVTPGIRAQKTNDDQKRTASIAEALSAGANYLVIGRPITHSENMLAAAQKINSEILSCA